MPHPLETYLHDLYAIHASGAGVDEISTYPALSHFLNEIGKSLKPKVRCITNLGNLGAGFPDAGLYTPDQFPKASSPQPKQGALPSRGAIEVKPPRESARAVAQTKQVKDYVRFYRQVLVVTHREFLLLGCDDRGQAVALESYRLADSEADFWEVARHPQKAATEHGDRLAEFLKRVMLYRAPLAEPQALAWFLASYAREARARVEERRDLPALAAVRAALEDALGLKFEGDKGEHFFRSTLVQTLFYGIFSAWVLWAKQRDPADTGRFPWREAHWHLHVPMIRALFQQLASPQHLRPLGLIEVLDWAEEALHRVDRPSFFAAFEEAYAVQYFYEPFLQAFDPELRKDLGVWYTPPEVVQYMVERVDRVLRSELDLADGLADPSVYVLDPCCGTGAYLVEVLKRIQKTLEEKGADALVAQDLKRAAIDRVFGFEILPAPFVIAHLQLGLLLRNLGAPFSDDADERAAVYLTNALTGWEPPREPKHRLPFIELEQERDAAERVKQHVPILVILGNPPYDGFAGVAIAEERVLTTAYRAVEGLQRSRGQGLNDPYVRFFRMAERRIVETTGRGIVCFISNYSWLEGSSFTGMRERYLQAFDAVWIDSLNGDKYKTGKTTPTGEPDPSVFSTPHNREGIQVGTAVALLARRGNHVTSEQVRFRQWWGKQKRSLLLSSLDGNSDNPYVSCRPSPDTGLAYLPTSADDDYAAWPRLPDLLPVSFAGVKTGRDNVLVSHSRETLERTLVTYFDASVLDDEIRTRYPWLMRHKKRCDPVATRAQLLRRGPVLQHIVRYSYRPFDTRWVYWEGETKLLDERRADYFPHVTEGNIWLTAGQRNRRDRFYQPQITRFLTDHHLAETNVAMFPLYLVGDRNADTLFKHGGSRFRPNLTAPASAYLSSLGLAEDGLFFHIIAALHAPTYGRSNMSALRLDWPRVPLPASQEVLLASAQLGKQIAALLDTEQPVPGVTSGAIRQELRPMAVASRGPRGQLQPDELRVTAVWGFVGQDDAIMPGTGKWTSRQYTPQEAAAIAQGAEAVGLSREEALAHLGETTRDVYLNHVAYWRNVPEKVWTYTIGGYQVMKKWLSYREADILGRPLTPEEVREVTNMARRIAAILLLEPALDQNYERVKAATYDWEGRTRNAL